MSIVVIGICVRRGINIMDENVWILAIPAVISLLLNIALLELYRKFRKRKG